jgi:hypothetical protein
MQNSDKLILAAHRDERLGDALCVTIIARNDGGKPRFG